MIKKTFLFVLAVAVSVSFVFSASAVAADKKIVAVLPFDSEGAPAWGKRAAQYLETLLVESGKFRVVERKKLQRILKEHELGQMGLTEMAKSLGSFVETDYLLGGSITPLGDSYSLNAKLIDIESAEIVYAKSTTFKNLKRLRKACQIVVKALAQRVYGTGSGSGSKAELFGMSDSRQFFDAAQLIIDVAQTITSNVEGTIDEVNGKKIYLSITRAIGMRPGLKLIVEGDSFEGTEEMGTIYITKYRKSGRSEASYLEEPQSLSMGMKVKSAGYKNRIVIGKFEDVEEENEDFVKQFRNTTIEAINNADSIEYASGTDDLVGQVRPSNLKSKLKQMFMRGADLYLTGRFIGTAGNRRLDLKIYNCYDGKLLKSIKLETKL